MCNSPSGFYWDFKAGKPLRFNGAAALYGRSYVPGKGRKKWGRFGGGDERKEDRTSRARLMDGKCENRIRFARSRIVEA